MNTDLNIITDKIIGAAYKISNELGAGFLEKVYENALVHQLKKEGLSVEQQKPIHVFYDDVLVGEYFADVLVAGQIILELKATKHITGIFLAQLLNYLRATGLHLGLIINFGKPKVEVKRVINSFIATDEHRN